MSLAHVDIFMGLYKSGMEILVRHDLKGREATELTPAEEVGLEFETLGERIEAI